MFEITNCDLKHAIASSAMVKMIHIRNVSDRLHRELVRRARMQGQTLTDYVEQILERELARPAREEVFERIASRTAVDLRHPVADLIRAERRAAGKR